MRMQCPECGELRPTGGDPCPSCGAEAPASGTGKGTSLRQWKERYQTGHLPGVQGEPSGGSGRLSNRASGELRTRSGPLAGEWASEAPSNSIPPTPARRSGGLLSGGLPSARQSGSLAPAPGTGDSPAPPPERRSGLLSNPARTSSTSGGFGNRSDSWRWQHRPGTGDSMASPLVAPEADDGQSDQEASFQPEPATQSSGRFRSGGIAPVPASTGRHAWGQNAPAAGGEEMLGSSPNLPALIEPGPRAGVPMLPDEEIVSRLAPGRKPPAFIPATRPRRPYRLSRYRIVSGIISLVLVVIAVGGGLGFLAVHTGLFQKIFGTRTLAPFNFEFPQPTFPALSGTPQPTPGDGNAVKVIVTVTTAKNYTNHYDPVNPTTTFKVGDTVNVLWQVRKAKANDVISIKWYQDGSSITNIDQKNTQETIAKDGDWNGVFGLAYPSPSVGTAEIYYNGTLAWTIQFVITN